MEQQETMLQGYTDAEKGAYIGAIASLATADTSASEEELEYIKALCESAELSEDQAQKALQAATDASGKDLKEHLDVLKNSDLRFSLIADLIAFSKSDSNYSEAEQQKVQEISQYLNVNQQQFSLLNQVTDQAAEQAASATSPQEAASPNFLSSSGLQSKLQGAGINTSSLLKGLLGFAGPLLLSKMFSRGTQGRGGGMFGGGGGMFGGGGLGSNLGLGGGLGSLIGMLSGGRGFGSTGGLLSKVLRGRF